MLMLRLGTLTDPQVAHSFLVLVKVIGLQNWKAVTKVPLAIYSVPAGDDITL